MGVDFPFTKCLFYSNSVTLFKFLNAVYAQIFKSILRKLPRKLSRILIYWVLFIFLEVCLFFGAIFLKEKVFLLSLETRRIVYNLGGLMKFPIVLIRRKSVILLSFLRIQLVFLVYGKNLLIFRLSLLTMLSLVLVWTRASSFVFLKTLSEIHKIFKIKSYRLNRTYNYKIK